MKKLIQKLKQKENGSSIYIIAMMFLLLMIVLFYFFYYQKAIEIIGSNLKNDLDSSNLASAYVDLDNYAANRNDFHIVNLDYGENRNFTVDGNKTVLTIGSKEYQNVMEHFNTYLTSIRENIGVSNSGFSGGSCGWAAKVLDAKDFVVEDFMILEPEGLSDPERYDSLTVYEIKNTTNIENPTPQITRVRYLSTRVQVGDTVTTIDTPSVYSKLSFTIALPNNLLRPGQHEYKTVTTSAMCGVLKNEK